MGELLWVSTRIRLELAFVVSRCSAMVLTAPKCVCEVLETVWAYLKSTPREGLWFGRDKGGQDDIHAAGGLRAYSDISFVPTGDGSVSHGAVYLIWNGALLWWRSGKQPFPTLSTAEAELVEAIEAFTLGDSVDAMILEYETGYIRNLLVDNQAAVALLGEGPVSWRTRHVKLRAQALRWRLTRLDWRACFIPGAVQIADLGTKPLAQQRMEDLKVLLGMGEVPLEKTVDAMNFVDEQDINEGETDKAVHVREIKTLKMALVLAVLASSLRGADAASEGEDDRYPDGFSTIVLIYTIAVMIATLVLRAVLGHMSGLVQVWAEKILRRAEAVGEGDHLRGLWREQGAERGHLVHAAGDAEEDVVRGGHEAEGHADLYGRPEDFYSPSFSPTDGPEAYPEPGPGKPEAEVNPKPSDGMIFIFVTTSGGRYHLSRQCGGLCSARRVFGYGIYRDCIGQDRLNGTTLHGLIRSLTTGECRKVHGDLQVMETLSPFSIKCHTKRKKRPLKVWQKQYKILSFII